MRESPAKEAPYEGKAILKHYDRFAWTQDVLVRPDATPGMYPLTALINVRCAMTGSKENSEMARTCCVSLSAVLLSAVLVAGQEAKLAPGPTADDLTKLIARLVELDSMDLAPRVKFREGLGPPLHALDADEAGMTALKDPYARFGEGKPGAAGWYRLSFVVPDKLGNFAVPKSGYNLGIESNVLGSWEIYTYKNGKPAGLWSKDGMNKAADRPATDWMSNAPQPAQPGDKFTVAILAMASPLGRGSPEGFGLRHLRLRFAWGHTGGRQPFYGSVYGPGQGTGLLGAREMLRTKTGPELQALQERLRGPLARLDAVFAAADTGKIDNLTKAMIAASKEINEALKK